MSATYGRFVVEKTGEPEVMKWISEPVQHPGANDIRVRHEAIGVDYIDTQIRGGLLPATLPTGLGFAGVGEAVEVGADVKHIKKGDRVAYMYFVAGSYGEERVVPADRVVALPDQTLSPELAAGALFRGLTAWYLANRLKPLGKGDTALVHAAAGGVGLILTQWLAHLGVTVIGTVDTREKAEALREFGCPHPVLMPDEDFVAKVKDVTGGKGVSVVYESIGVATFERSLDCAKRFGLIASYGWPSGDPDNVSLMTLRTKGSLFITRPTVTQYTAESEDFRAGAAALFDLIKQGKLRIKVGNSYPLREAARAHADLVAGRTLGSVVLVP
ncbi:quinone oxidoreductase [Bradyrhizobium sp. PRIMUS42]|uniref:quinone oxidoreductase family protein n=1 Tax=Bradyrhizobium sp. PRIMUS42 TaxID=2908926 RepID=UPI001FF2BEA3|nr:quinone oxidoreductase [Bradyrhizobium sp. PRIMUS42]MCJ9728684.1 quinone oxidoreductase [Bradyrhizobium sp. PRIMUS42]